MKPQIKSFLKKMLLTDFVILIVGLLIGMILIVPNCTFDCEIRGNLFGGGLTKLIFSIDVFLGIGYWLKHRK